MVEGRHKTNIKEYPKGYDFKTEKLKYLPPPPGVINIEKYPEFWEKIEEKEYEILGYKYKWNDHIYDIKREIIGGLQSWWCKEDTWISPETNGSYIYSIKRLSDGEVFTIGDTVKHKQTSNTGKILSMYLSKCGKIFFSTEYCNSEIGTSLRNVIKVNNPLFTTEDGVDIYERNSYYYCFTFPYYKVGKVNEARKEGDAAKGLGEKNHKKYFSTKEAAEKWIEENKPKYSKKDLKSLLDYVDQFFCMTSDFKEKKDLFISNWNDLYKR